MKQNKSYICITCILVIIFLSGCFNKATEKYQQTDNIILFDSNKSITKYDMENILDGSFSIIPLETNDNCVIASIDKIEIVKEIIYILDRTAKSIYKFDSNGNYIDKLSALGLGPGEYANITDMTVTDSSIVIVDTYSHKQIEYDLETMKVLSESRVFEQVWAMAIFQLSNTLYYLNDWSDSSVGKYRLFSKNKGSDEFNKFLKFEDAPVALALGDYTCHYAKDTNRGLIIYNGCDIIYRIDKDSVFAEYSVLFEDDKVIYKNDAVENVFEDNENGRILGISSINESEKYIFFDVDVIGDEEYSCIYNKASKETIVYNRVATSSYLDNEQIIVQRVIDDKIIDWREASTMVTQNEYIYAKKDFQNKDYETKLKNALNNLTEDDNPVLFIYKLKLDI